MLEAGATVINHVLHLPYLDLVVISQGMVVDFFFLPFRNQESMITSVFYYVPSFPVMSNLRSFITVSPSSYVLFRLPTLFIHVPSASHMLCHHLVRFYYLRINS